MEPALVVSPPITVICVAFLKKKKKVMDRDARGFRFGKRTDGGGAERGREGGERVFVSPSGSRVGVKTGNPTHARTTRTRARTSPFLKRHDVAPAKPAPPPAPATRFRKRA